MVREQLGASSEEITFRDGLGHDQQASEPVLVDYGLSSPELEQMEQSFRDDDD